MTREILALALLVTGTTAAAQSPSYPDISVEEAAREAIAAADAALEKAGANAEELSGADSSAAAEYTLEQAAAAVEEATRQVMEAGRARYISVGTAGAGASMTRVYVDKDSLKVTPGGYRRAWTTTIFRGLAAKTPNGIRSMRSLEEVDCAEGRHRTLTTVLTRHNSNSYQTSPVPSWQYTVPDTSMAGIASAICGEPDEWSQVADPNVDAAAYFAKRRQ